MLITFEGIEGSGKSTQAKNLYNWLLAKGFDCVLTKEPGATYIGKKIREILLIPQKEKISEKAELFLYLADRAQHVELVIRPALKSNKIVIVDRFIDSTVVYQGYGRGIPLEILNHLNQLILDGIKPDITFLLDLDPEEGLKRVKKRNEQDHISRLESRFEQEDIEFHKKIRAGYLQIQQGNPDRIVLLDAKRESHEIFKEIIFYFEKFMGITKNSISKVANCGKGIKL